MKKKPWMQFYPADWRAEPRLRMCSLAARGLWIDLMTYMHEGQPYGHFTIEGIAPDLDGMAALVSRPLDEVKAALAELEAKQVFSRTADGVIFSRRMVRDREKLEENTTVGGFGGNPNVGRGAVPKEQRVRPYKRTDSPQKTKRIFDRSQGKCHWCGAPLIWSGTGVEPNQFHVDHIIAVKDGGTNEESNLVAAGAMCNRKRAGLGSMTCMDGLAVVVGQNSDNNAQIPESKFQKPDLVSSGSSGGKEAARSSGPRHGITSQRKGRIYIKTGTPEWAAYAADFREVRGFDPEPNQHGGKWFNIAGERQNAG